MDVIIAVCLELSEQCLMESDAGEFCATVIGTGNLIAKIKCKTMLISHKNLKNDMFSIFSNFVLAAWASTKLAK